MNRIHAPAWLQHGVGLTLAHTLPRLALAAGWLINGPQRWRPLRTQPWPTCLGCMLLTLAIVAVCALALQWEG